MNKLTEQEKNIIEELRKLLVIDNSLNNDERELMWRLCSTFNGYNYNKVIDYINVRDSYYIEELITIICDELDQEYLVNKTIGTDDKTFNRLKNVTILCNIVGMMNI